MDPSKLKEYFNSGVVQVVVITPFKNNEDVDYEGLKENVNYLVEKRKYGQLVITPTGSTGEFYALNDEEWRKVVKTVIDVVNGKVPVVVGTSSAGTRRAIEKAKYAQDIGADGVMVVLPYYHVPEEEGLYLHYKTIADSINIGLQIYNNPDTSKIYMKPNLLKRLISTTDNIVAVKENTPYVQTFYEEVRTVGDKVAILQGRGEFWFYVTAPLGAKGFVSGYANCIPEVSLELLNAWKSKDLDAMKRILDKIMLLEDFIEKLSLKYGPSTTILPYPYVSSYMIYSVIKSCMDILGLHGGSVRLPLINLKDEDKEELKNIVSQIIKEGV